MTKKSRDYRSIYRDHADLYDAMVSAEDVDHNVLSALRERVPDLSRANVVEVGVGTGRVTRQLLATGARVHGVEPEAAMLAIARERTAEHAARVDLRIGDLESLPFEDASADLGVAAWVFGHQRSFAPDDWRTIITRGVRELERVVKPGGCVVLFETLGTGVVEPDMGDTAAPDSPRARLLELQRYLEEPLGFDRTVISTDYSFASPEEAARGMRFFFGEEMATRILENGWARVPEWTGVWSKRQ